MNDGETARGEQAEHGDAPVPAEEQRSGKGAAAALGGLILVAGVMVGVIATDAGWLGGVEDPPPTPVSVSQSATPACGETGSCANGAKRGATPATSRARPSARPPSKTRNSGTSSGSGSRQSQADLARKARDGYAPRPPSAPGIDQEELDRQRDETESTVAPVPADNGSNPSP